MYKKEQRDEEEREGNYTNKTTKPKVRVENSLPNGICRIFNSKVEQPKLPQASAPTFQPA
jgi:hypothetical protein